MAAIFIGEVVSVVEPERNPSEPGAGRVRYRFRVERPLKGELGETVDVFTPASPAACGVRFAEKTRHLVFLHRPGGSAAEDDGFETNLCDFNVSGDDVGSAAAEVERILEAR